MYFYLKKFKNRLINDKIIFSLLTLIKKCVTIDLIYTNVLLAIIIESFFITLQKIIKKIP